MSENKVQITRMLTPTQRKQMEALAEFLDVSQSDALGQAITEAWEKSCAENPELNIDLKKAGKK